MPPTTQQQNLGTPAASQQTVADVVSTPQSPQLRTPGITPVVDATKLDTEQLQVPSQRDILQEQIDKMIAAPLADNQAALEQRSILSQFLTSSEKLGEQTADREALLQQADTQKFEQQIRDVNAEARRLQTELATGELRRMQEGGLGTFIRSDINEARQQAAIELQALAATSELAQGNLLAAENRVERALAAKYDPIKNKIETLQNFFQLNEAILTREEKTKAETLNRQLEQLKSQQEEMRNKEEIATSFLLQAQGKGAEATDIAKMMRKVATGELDPADVIERYGALLARPDELEQLKIDNQRLINRQIQQEIDNFSAQGVGGLSIETLAANPELAQFAQIAPTLATKFGSKFQQEQFLADFNSRLARGDINGLTDILLSNAIDTIGSADAQKKARGNIDIIRQINEVEQLFADFEDKGGKTNIFVGNIQDAKNKVGLLGDPELADIGIRIANLLDTLARARTGAALTESEEKFYKQFFPSSKKTSEFNSSIISSLRDSLKSTIETDLRLQLTNSGYETIEPYLSGFLTQTRGADAEIVEVATDYVNEYLNQSTFGGQTAFSTPSSL